MITEYPDIDDENFYVNIFKKREFPKQQIRPSMDSYENIKEYRDKICAPDDFNLTPHQIFLGNFINPETPYKGLLLFHGTGTGKTCAGVTIAENFKDLSKKYGQKILVLVPGKTLKTNFTDELVGKCTGNTYMNKDMTIYDKQLKRKQKNAALRDVYQYYNIMSYKKFLKKVLGEKVKNKFRKYMKNRKGKTQREPIVNPITYLSNTLLIVDEAHNVINNDQGKSILKIMKNPKSVNLKVILMTATPMNNLASDIVYLLNIIRPKSDPIIEKKVFKFGDTSYDVKLREGGLNYLKEKAKGYISYIKGADPVTFAKRVDIGIVPKELEFTKLVQCYMEDFQASIYDKISEPAGKENMHIENSSKLVNISNIVFPIYNRNTENMMWYFGIDGIKKVHNTLRNISDLGEYFELMDKKIPNIKVDINFIKQSKEDSVKGSFLKMENLKYFSIKFYQALLNIGKNIVNPRTQKTDNHFAGPGLIFVYSNLVAIGVNIFEEVLKENGYVDYRQKKEWRRNPNAICYKCGFIQKQHLNKDHSFSPAIFVSLTGQSEVQENEGERDEILNTFRNPDNTDGRHIKILLGTSVLAEGTTLLRIREIHILDAYYTLTRIDQIIGRGIRHCSHYALMSDQNVFPNVKVFKYVASLKNKSLSHEERLYKIAEWKYKLIKIIERGLKEVSIDCAQNRQANVFNEDIIKYKNCGKEGHPPCPQECDFQDCNYYCDDKKLNELYFDKEKDNYKYLKLSDLDDSTFSGSLIRHEIEFSKKKIVEMYRFDFVYTLGKIVDHVKHQYPPFKRNLFDIFFVYKALDELIPKSKHDFNTFKDIIKDIYNRRGYIVVYGKYYIFQPFGMNDNVSMNTRRSYDDIPLPTQTLNIYLKSKGVNIEETFKVVTDKGYDFESTKKYYDSRPEFDVVGIFSKQPDRKKTMKHADMKDVFNVRYGITKKGLKKREKGLPSLMGADCLTKSKTDISKIARILNIKINKKDKRKDICENIKKELLHREKYQKGNQMTYVIIPANHEKYTFPYSLVDRYQYVVKEINNYFRVSSITIKLIKEKDKIKLEGDFSSARDTEFLESLRGVNKGTHWEFKMD